MSIAHPPQKYAWQTVVVIDDRNPPTLNTLHEVFNETGGVRLLSLVVYQTNTPTNCEDIDVVITVDGVAYMYDGSAIGCMNDSTEYSIYSPMHSATIAAYTIDMIGTQTEHPFTLDGVQPSTGYAWAGHAIMVQIRQTSAIGVGARIRTKAVYQVLRPV